MNLVKISLALGLLYISLESLATRKEIREVDTNDHLMKVVHLTMGRSTVLSFEEKPVKVISGNSNYFNVEFVGNDLTLQPLAPVDTNLFVYTEKGTKFGFILTVGSSHSYDDILYIKWRSDSEIRLKSLPPQKILQPFKLDLGQDLEIRVKSFSRLGEMKTYLIDFEVLNKGKKLKTESLDIFVSRSNQRFLGQELISEKKEIDKGELSRGRLITRIEQKQDFTLTIKVSGKEVRSIILKDYL